MATTVKPPTAETPKRRVVRAPAITQPITATAQTGSIPITARPSKDGIDCDLLLAEPLVKEAGWWFPDAEAGAGSPLAARLFEVDHVGRVVIDHATVTIGRPPGDNAPWPEVAAAAGAAIRQHLEASEPILSDDIVARIPDAETVRTAVQEVIDHEVNPGIAAHSGNVRLISVRGNAVWIEMGGGCQGCSAAALTLRHGIEGSFRRALPELGAIYDATDHAAGTNPFFS